jgi:hypothetical protein
VRLGARTHLGTNSKRLTVLTPNAVGAMLCFLKLCKPFDEPEVWRQYVSKAGDEKRAKLLRVRVISVLLAELHKLTQLSLTGHCSVDNAPKVCPRTVTFLRVRVVRD